MFIKSIYIAEHENMFADCLSANLQLDGKFEVIGISSNGAEAFNEIREGKPDLVITAVNLDALSGINLIRKIKAAGFEAKVILLS